ncbi:hypothetical protein RUND412_001806 [Rhizina undulata]
MYPTSSKTDSAKSSVKRTVRTMNANGNTSHSSKSSFPMRIGKTIEVTTETRSKQDATERRFASLFPVITSCYSVGTPHYPSELSISPPPSEHFTSGDPVSAVENIRKNPYSAISDRPSKNESYHYQTQHQKSASYENDDNEAYSLKRFLTVHSRDDALAHEARRAISEGWVVEGDSPVISQIMTHDGRKRMIRASKRRERRS